MFFIIAPMDKKVMDIAQKRNPSYLAQIMDILLKRKSTGAVSLFVDKSQANKKHKKLSNTSCAFY